MCDGHIAGDGLNKSMRLFLRQALDHLPHVELFRRFVGTTNSIVTGTHLDPAGIEQEHCCLAITNNLLCSRLKKFGMVELKPNRRIEDPRLIHSRDFWRGCVDADGCVYGCNSMYLSGHPPLLNQWLTVLDWLGCQTPLRIDQPGCIRYQSSGAAARTLTSWLYQDGDVALSDKLLRAKRWIR